MQSHLGNRVFLQAILLELLRIIAMNVYRVIMEDSSVVEIYADYEESAMKMAEENYGQVAVIAESV